MLTFEKDFPNQNCQQHYLWLHDEHCYSPKYSEFLTGEEILPSNQKQIIEQIKCTYSPLGRAFKEQTKDQVKAIKNLNICSKTNGLKQIEGIFPRNLLNDWIYEKLKKNY